MVSRGKSLELSPVSPKEPAGRGRPVSSDSRCVSEDIIHATLTLLEHKSPQQITTKEIAALAGTRTSMIHYYFGGKDKLIVEIVRRNLAELLDDITRMGEAIRNGEVSDPTRAMIALFAAAHNRHPAMARIVTPEMLRQGSPISSFYMQQWPAHGNRILTDLVAHLSATGYYRAGVNAKGISRIIRSVVFFPMMIKPYLVLEGESAEYHLDGEWIDFVATVLDSYLRPPGQRPARKPTTGARKGAQPS